MTDEAKPVQVDETKKLSTDEGGAAAEVEETRTVEGGDDEADQKGEDA